MRLLWLPVVLAACGQARHRPQEAVATASFVIASESLAQASSMVLRYRKDTRAGRASRLRGPAPKCAMSSAPPSIDTFFKNIASCI
jgi:hypothetical protein